MSKVYYTIIPNERVGISEKEFKTLREAKNYLEGMDRVKREELYCSGADASICKWRDKGCCEVDLLRTQDFVCSEGRVKYRRPEIFRENIEEK